MAGQLFSPSIFRYTQASASSSWAIAHNLGTNGSTGIPVVDAYIYVSGVLTKVIPSSTTMNDKNTVTLTFAQPQTGVAIVIV
jgi:hypothetical protein